MRPRAAEPTARPAGAVLVLMALAALIGSAWSVRGATPNQASNRPAEAARTTSEKNVPENIPGGPTAYRIGAGDVLEINVWKEPEASVPSVVVRPDGKVSLPLVKELDVLGLTPVELEKALTLKLAHFINSPDVTVVVKEIHSKNVYVVGAVNKVGPVPLLSAKTVLQVLAEAGGLTEYAKKKKVYVLRSEGGKQVKLPFDYQAVIKGENMEQNIVVRADDTIVVPH